MDSKNVEIAIQGQVKPVIFQKELAFSGPVVTLGVPFRSYSAQSGETLRN